MYTAHYGLREKPFGLTPDPRFLYLSAAHREALAHVLYGIEQGFGFIAVTGEVGTGKTTLCRTLLERLPAETEVALLFNPALDSDELMLSIALELDLPLRGRGRAEISEALSRFLVDANRGGRRVLLVVDEAQGLSTEALEQIRMLSNLETSREKLIQIVLFGQPELDTKLDAPELRQLRQRISVRWRLDTLGEAESREYLRHRVRVAAGGACDLFSDAALRRIQRRARGIPRVMNLLADRSLLAGYAAGARRVEGAHVEQAAREVLAAQGRRRMRWRRAILRGAKEST